MLRKKLIYGVEKSKIRKYLYHEGVYVELIIGTRRYLGKKKYRRHNMKKIKLLQIVVHTGKKFTDFGTLLRKKFKKTLTEVLAGTFPQISLFKTNNSLPKINCDYFLKTTVYNSMT